METRDGIGGVFRGIKEKAVGFVGLDMETSLDPVNVDTGSAVDGIAIEALSPTSVIWSKVTVVASRPQARRMVLTELEEVAKTRGLCSHFVS